MASIQSEAHHPWSHSGRKASIAIETTPVPDNVNDTIKQDAARISESEKSMTLIQGIRTYPKAVAWSILISTCIIMEGFDIVLINSLFALPAFKRAFGTEDGHGNYHISAAWQSGLSNGALTGEVIGLMFIGVIAERYGFRKTLIGALMALTGFIFVVFFAESLPILLVGEVCMGIPWGAFQTLTTTYASEVCPVVLRPYLTTYVNLCWVIGQFFASAVLKGVSASADPRIYRIPYGLQWLWPLPLIVGIYLAPESPWWLVRSDRPADAQAQLRRLCSKQQHEADVEATVNMMIYTNELEKKHVANTRYLDCFRGSDLRRTELVCGVWAIQTLCGGSSFTGYSTYFFQQAGLDVSHSFSLSLGQYALGAVGTILSWFLMLRCGRRTLYLHGQIIMASLLLVVGCLSFSSSPQAPWGIGAMLLVYNFVYDATLGPVCYSLVTELASTRLRQKTVVLARNLYNVTGIAANVLTSHMLDPTSLDLGAKTGFVWAGIGTLCATWTYFRLPEPNGRTFVEIDMLFQANVPARRFKTADVSALPTSGEAGVFKDTNDTKCRYVERIELVDKL